MDEKEIKELKKENRNLNKYLTGLTKVVQEYLKHLDEEMKKPSDVERGRRIAKLSNALEYANDQARYFGLGIDFRTGKKKKK